MDMAGLAYTLGALEIGVAVSTFLFGITTLQSYTYCSRFPEDRWQLKLLVLTVFILELAHVVALLHSFYTISILQYGHPEQMFFKSPVGIDASIFLSSSIASIVQAFFTHRLRKISGWVYITTICWSLSSLRLVAAIAITIVMFKHSPVDVRLNWRWLVTCSWIIGVTADVLIAVLLCYELVNKRKSSFIATTRIMDWLIIMTIQTGLFTSLMTLAVTISFFVMNDTLVWLAIYVCLSRVFSISLLGTLNARTSLRQMNDNNIISFALAPGAEPNVQASKLSPFAGIQMLMMPQASPIP